MVGWEKVWRWMPAEKIEAWAEVVMRAIGVGGVDGLRLGEGARTSSRSWNSRTSCWLKVICLRVTTTICGVAKETSSVCSGGMDIIFFEVVWVLLIFFLLGSRKMV